MRNLRLTPLRAMQQVLDRLSVCMPRATIALLLLDIDHFKRINSVYGHSAGNRLIAALERRFARICDPGLMVHMGGGEFAFFHPLPDPAQGSGELARALLSLIDQPIRIDSHLVHLSASVGTAESPPGDWSGEDLLHRASLALVHAKGLGSGTHHAYSVDIKASQSRRAALEHGIRAAIANGEVRPHYQPVVSLRSRTTVGFEVLARWHHPDHGVLSPDLFLPIAHQRGLIDDLFFAILARACENAALLPDTIALSVNLAPRQLMSARIAPGVLDVLKRTGLGPDRLTIEITEESLLPNVVHSAATLAALREAGIRIALDDFGNGYGNLARLAQLPVDMLKIDRALTQAMDTAVGHDLVTTVLDLSRKLSVGVTAEGIETEAQADRLAALGCMLGQGFLFGRPEPQTRLN